LDLASGDVAVIDTTREPLHAVKVEADVLSLEGKPLLHREAVVDAAADDVTRALRLDLAPLLGDGTVLVQLSLRSAEGALLSENLYWRAATDAGYGKLTQMAPAQLVASARSLPLADQSGNRRLEVRLKNAGPVAALNVKLVARETNGGAEVLPAFYSDNYVSLLPGRERTLTVELPRAKPATPLEVKVYGWNVGESTIAVPNP
jgi:hypothetical protein